MALERNEVEQKFIDKAIRLAESAPKARRGTLLLNFAAAITSKLMPDKMAAPRGAGADQCKAPSPAGHASRFLPEIAPGRGPPGSHHLAPGEFLLFAMTPPRSSTSPERPR